MLGGRVVERKPRIQPEDFGCHTRYIWGRFDVIHLAEWLIASVDKGLIGG
jgi:hypothetical protein